MPLQATSGAASYDAFGGGVAAVPNYIEDVFSTWLYPSISGDNQIINNIDLSTKGGLVWIKSRDSNNANFLIDTIRGSSVGNTNAIKSNTTGAQTTGPNLDYLNFNTDGFTAKAVSGGGELGTNPYYGKMASWTFRKQPKFFDVVTYTGNSVIGRAIPHNLGSAPGCVIVKSTDAAGENWAVWHRSGTQNGYFSAVLNSTSAYASQGGAYWQNNGVAPDMNATTFSVGNNGATNQTGNNYVAYLFAHDAGGFGLTGTDNVISCGTYTGNGSNDGPTITLGYEPQWLLIKDSTTAKNWQIFDNMRGMVVGLYNSDSDDAALQPNLSNAESLLNGPRPNATGFSVGGSAQINTGASTYIYIAIRRGPMKVPTVGTSVFAPVAQNGGGTVTTNFPVDLSINTTRAGTDKEFMDRLRGGSQNYYNYLASNLTSVESTGTGAGLGFDNNTGYVDNGWWSSSLAVIYWNFRRAPSFFDEVCYTGDNAAPRTLSHNLGVAPELLITKRRSAGGTTGTNRWYVTAFNLPLLGPNYQSGILNGTDAFDVFTQIQTAPTSTTFTLGVDSFYANISPQTYVAYLFATCAGVSKVFSYTGNGSSQTINCGFTGGARWILIKRTDSTGDWYVWDSARGIVAGNDPHLSLNSTAAEVTTDDSVDTDSTGFIVNQLSATNVNVTSATYIGIAIA